MLFDVILIKSVFVYNVMSVHVYEKFTVYYELYYLSFCIVIVILKIIVKIYNNSNLLSSSDVDVRLKT